MQDNFNINSVTFDKKTQLSTNITSFNPLKSNDEPNKPINPNTIVINPIFNPPIPNILANSPQKHSPAKIPINLSNKPPKTPQKVTFNSQNNNNNSINLPNPANIEKDKWLTLESNEIYVIRNESINKTNEWIYYKLQREKYLNKRTNPFAERTEDERIKGDMSNFRKSFANTKDLCSLLTNTKRKLQKKQDKLKKSVDLLSKEIKFNNFSNLKEVEIAKHYMYEMAKDNMRRRSSSQNLKSTEENENK